MRSITIIFLVTLSMLFAVDYERVDYNLLFETIPGPATVIDTSDSSIIDPVLPRYLITFNIPEEILDTANRIHDARLFMRVEEGELLSMEVSDSMPIMAYCVPIVDIPVGTPTWGWLESSYNLDYSRFGIADVDSGLIMFDITRMLESVSNGDIVTFGGIAIIPAKGSPPFGIREDRDISIKIKHRKMRAFREE